jgi:hypothetical protein
MTCTSSIRRGVGGCMVTNYKNETDKAQHRPNLGTVAMNVSPEGFTRFYVFLPNGVLSPSALLDDEGPKFAPRLCTVCHGGGRAAAPDTKPDLGSIFREFQPTQLEAETGLSRPDAEAEWFALNQAIRTANQSVRGESEGGPAGIDHAKAAMGAYLDALYPDLAPPARTLTDPALTPVSWQSDAKNTTLWNKVVAPYCMGCHRHNADDWSVYGNFDFLQDERDGVGLLREYVTGSAGAHPYPFMPQSELGYTLLGADSSAQHAIDAWLPCHSGSACVPTNPCHKGKVTCAASGPSCRDTGALADDGTSCGGGAVCSNGACTTGVCRRTVLVLADAPHPDVTDADNDKLRAALVAAGLQPTVIADGSATFSGRESAANVGAIIVTPGRTEYHDMPADGQSAIVSASVAGTGVVFTEPSAYLARLGSLQQLAPLMLIEHGSSMLGTYAFTFVADSHPVWSGLPTIVVPQLLMGFTDGPLINGGVEIADIREDGTRVGPGVVVRDGAAGSGRVVHISHDAARTAGWEADGALMKMFTNSVRWAAHCD